MRFLELLAPARNADIGIAAIDCGADAVYIAGPAFGARKDAGNEVSEIRRLCDYAHQFGARVFVTINTIIYDSELEEVSRLVSEVRSAGADAVIAQDLALLKICSSGFGSSATAGSAETPEGATVSSERAARDLPLLASTQCSVRTAQKAVELEALGFSRITLERELSLEQIRSIAGAVDCEVECFVHGALCVCYSGQCYLSEFLDGRSANRGACVQACRSRYDVLDKNGRVLVRDKAVLSLKDLNLLSRLSDLADAGVTSFKIEGRLKNISYVRNVVRAYSLALDSLIAHSGGRFARASFGSVRKGFTPNVNRTFNRGYTSLFLDGLSNGDSRGEARGVAQNSAQRVAAMDAAKAMGERLGRVSALSPDFRSFRIDFTKDNARSGSKGDGRNGKTGFGRDRKNNGAPQINAGVKLSNGDGLAFVARNGEIIGLRADVVDGAMVKCKRVPELYDGATIFRNFDIAFEREMAANPCVRMLSASVSAEFSVSEGAGNGDSSFVNGDKNRPVATVPVGTDSRDTTKIENSRGVLNVTARSEDGRCVEKTYTDLWSDYAENTARMQSMWQTQMSKTAGIFSFTPDGPITSSIPANSAVLPLLSAAAMNAIRADLATALAELPRNPKPIYINPAASQFSETSDKNNPQTGKDSQDNINKTIEADQPTEPKTEISKGPTTKPRAITYKDNVANKIAEGIYASANLPVTESAYELTHRPKAELMRTKYCLRRELNLCPNPHRLSAQDNATLSTRTPAQNTAPSPTIHPADPLYLLNNGRRLTALFDCHHCEMVIKSE